MTQKTKNQIANDIYGDDYAYLSETQKEAVTEEFNSQSTEVEAQPEDVVKATIGRVGVNGSKTCMLNDGAKIRDLLEQAQYGFDSRKEKILDVDTGFAVDLDDEVDHNGSYAIAVEIKSA